MQKENSFFFSFSNESTSITRGLSPCDHYQNKMSYCVLFCCILYITATYLLKLPSLRVYRCINRLALACAKILNYRKHIIIGYLFVLFDFFFLLFFFFFFSIDPNNFLYRFNNSLAICSSVISELNPKSFITTLSFSL